jgi:hypothetical protein
MRVDRDAGSLEDGLDDEDPDDVKHFRIQKL